MMTLHYSQVIQRVIVLIFQSYSLALIINNSVPITDRSLKNHLVKNTNISAL